MSLLCYLYGGVYSFESGLARMSQQTNLFVFDSRSNCACYATNGNVYDVIVYLTNDHLADHSKKARCEILPGTLVGIYNGRSIFECLCLVTDML